MGKRNISLVAGGVARSNVGTVTPTATNNTGVAEIAQMYLPEPGGTLSLFAGALDCSQSLPRGDRRIVTVVTRQLRFLCAMLLVGSAASAAPKTYVFTESSPRATVR
jgi:hypothetical protein